MNQNSINEVISKDLCTGCTSCVLICPQKAISLYEDENGFLSPEIDDKKCTNCGLCKQVCPVFSDYKKDKEISCFSGWSTDKDNLLKSSSGGIFFEIAKEFIRNKGYVVGVIMKDERPIHILSNKISDLEKMRGSKYIQSNPQKIIGNIIGLSKHKKILFVGTPCQVVGLKNIVTIKGNIKNLFFIDLICHGVPSFKSFDKYFKNSKILSFRDKSFGWENFSIRLIENGKEKIIPIKQDKFMQIFLSDICLRNSCYKCKFSKSPTSADITLGDYWGCPKGIKNNRGTSAVIVHTKKGSNLIRDLEKSRKIILNETTFFDISKGNPKILDGVTKKPRDRKLFLDSLRTNNFDKTYNKFVRLTFYKKVRNFAYHSLKNIKTKLFPLKILKPLR